MAATQSKLEPDMCAHRAAPHGMPRRYGIHGLKILCCLAATATLAACYGMQPSQGGGETAVTATRQVQPSDIRLPAGYSIEAIASGLTYPTGVAFDAAGVPHVVEAGYSYGEDWKQPRLLRVEQGGRLVQIAAGGRNGPWSGVAFGRGAFYVAEGGALEGGRILEIAPDGATRVLIEGLPTRGDHHTNGPAVGPDGAIYFATGVATNAGIVGPDNADMGWLKREPQFADVPCRDVTLTGANLESADPIGGRTRVNTGAFVPFGMTTTAGQVIPGRIPCSGAVLRIGAAGGTPELVAWGLRNPFGLAFSPAGQLYVTENSYDERGSRGIFGTGDLMWPIVSGTWYGWPDYHGQRRVDDPDFAPPGKPTPRRLLAAPATVPPKPAAVFAVHASANGFDFSRSDAFGHVGQAFVAEFGDMASNTGKVLAPVGFKVVRVDAATGVIEDFAVNAGPENGPASAVGGGGLERPIAARFSPDGAALYIVDFGVMTMGERGPEPRAGTGVLWRVVRAR